MQAGRENRLHIGIYGRCNVGKSSFLNYITDSEVALVSPHSGTTTDPVRKAYEILGFAPVIWIDTAGLDDTSAIGELRVKKTLETLPQIDLAVIIYKEWGDTEETFAKRLQSAGIAYVVVENNDGFEDKDSIISRIKAAVPSSAVHIPSLFGDKVSADDVVLLVCPIDSEAPAGRLILPQVQAIRELLDGYAVAVVVQPPQIAGVFNKGIIPSLVVTDSQLFAEVRAAVPQNIELTSFSILLAAAKGDMEAYKRGLQRVDNLKKGDRILIVENCLHQVSCEDIGRVKIPEWLQRYTRCKLEFTFVSGLSPLPEDMAGYSLVIQCGGCMVTRSQLQNRIRQALLSGVEVTNYGMLIRKIRLRE